MDQIGRRRTLEMEGNAMSDAQDLKDVDSAGFAKVSFISGYLFGAAAIYAGCTVDYQDNEGALWVVVGIVVIVGSTILHCIPATRRRRHVGGG